jgi:hypothetical protein
MAYSKLTSVIQHKEAGMMKGFNKDVLRQCLLFVAGVCLMMFVAACVAIEDTAVEDTEVEDTAVEDTALEDTLYANAFAGEVNEELFIGVLVAEDQPVPDRKALIVYLCDGADISTWLFGETMDDTVVLEAGDIHVALSLGEDSVTGEVEQAGAAPQAFTAEFATEDAGLFRAVETVDGQDYVGGWVVLNDGRQRGALTLGGEVIENPTLDLAIREAETSIGRMGSNCFINPHTGERICRYLN